MGRLIGYARVSTDDQNVDLQIDSLRNAGADPIFVDRGVSGATRSRPELDRCLRSLRAGDTLVVWKLDRLGRSLTHLVTLIDGLRQRDIGLRSVTETIDTTTSHGRLLFGLFSTLAEFERSLIRERVNAGLEAARRRGQHLGRRRSLTPSQVDHAAELVAAGRSLRQVGDLLGVAASTVKAAVDRRQVSG